MSGPGTNTGHGHVWERPDGMKARCGGPGMCSECSRDQAQWPPRMTNNHIPAEEPVFEIRTTAPDAHIKIWADGRVEGVKAGIVIITNRMATLTAETERQRQIGADLAQQLSAALAENSALNLRIVKSVEGMIAEEPTAR